MFEVTSTYHILEHSNSLMSSKPSSLEKTPADCRFKQRYFVIVIDPTIGAILEPSRVSSIDSYRVPTNISLIVGSGQLQYGTIEVHQSRPQV